jgi:hypothetical protein
MYCSSCGSAVTPGLSYCNRCGAGLEAKLEAKKALDDKGSTLPESLVWATVGVSVGGLAIIVGLMAVMKHELHFANGLIVLFSLLSFALLLAAESVFIWMLLSSYRRTRSREKEASDITQLKGTVTRELGEPQERLLGEPGVSVTEHTTRTLEPVYRERKTE